MHGQKIADYRTEVAAELIGFFKKSMPELRLRIGKLSGGPSKPLIINKVGRGLPWFRPSVGFGEVTSGLGKRVRWVITAVIYDSAIAKRKDVIEFIARLGVNYKAESALLTFWTGTPEKPELIYKAVI